MDKNIVDAGRKADDNAIKRTGKNKADETKDGGPQDLRDCAIATRAVVSEVDRP